MLTTEPARVHAASRYSRGYPLLQTGTTKALVSLQFSAGSRRFARVATVRSYRFHAAATTAPKRAGQFAMRQMPMERLRNRELFGSRRGANMMVGVSDGPRWSRNRISETLRMAGGVRRLCYLRLRCIKSHRQAESSALLALTANSIPCRDRAGVSY